MSNTETIEALVSAIEHDRFREIAELHRPGAVFHTFRGPTVSGGTAAGGWYAAFLRDYADCSYSDRALLEQGDVAALAATLGAKGVDWRAFDQRVLEFFEFEEGLVAARRIYAMPARFEYPKPVADAVAKLKEAEGVGASSVEATARGFVEALLAGDRDGARAFLSEDSVLVDGVFGVATGSDSVLELVAALPAPAFGVWRLSRCVAGNRAAALEMAIDPARPRAAAWVRVSEEKVASIEIYWMLREIGVTPAVGSMPRHPKQVILPI
ncbi:MAG: nuclear transport factor 2 family protein [Dehalococcoidia bacterium]